MAYRVHPLFWALLLQALFQVLWTLHPRCLIHPCLARLQCSLFWPRRQVLHLLHSSSDNRQICCIWWPVAPADLSLIGLIFSLWHSCKKLSYPGCHQILWSRISICFEKQFRIQRLLQYQALMQGTDLGSVPQCDDAFLLVEVCYKNVRDVSDCADLWIPDYSRCRYRCIFVHILLRDELYSLIEWRFCYIFHKSWRYRPVTLCNFLRGDVYCPAEKTGDHSCYNSYLKKNENNNNNIN